MVHNHDNWVGNTNNDTHDHPNGYTPNIDCGIGKSHGHYCTYQAGGAHSHADVTLSFANAALGSPNWYEHAHAITLVGTGNGGGAHSDHTIDPYTLNGYCTVCTKLAPHLHATTLTCGSGGYVHTHNLIDPTNTDYADPSGTPEAHTHDFSIILILDGGHNHTITGTITNATCTRGYNHGHTPPAYMTTASMSHPVSGTSASGGESAAGIAARRLLVGEGL